MFAYSPTGPAAATLLRPGAADTLVIKGISVIDASTTAPRPGMTVVVRRRRIDEILEPGVDGDHLESEATVLVDGSGLYLTPGLIDCHVHLTGLRGTDPFRRYIERYRSIHLLRAVRDANNVLLAGFTTVRHLGHGDAGQAEALKQSIRRGLVAGPRMLTSGWAISQTGGHGNLHAWSYGLVESMRPRSAFCDGPDQLRTFVRQLLAGGAEWVKIYATEGVISTPDHTLDAPNFTMAELAAVVDEAHRGGARVAAHATGLEGSMNAVRSGVDTLEHGPHAPDEAFLQQAKASGATLVPTMSVFEWAATHGADNGLPAWAAERAAGWLAGRRELVRTAASWGIPIGVGSDSGSPPRGGRNAAEVVALSGAGLGPARALAAATADSSHALGISHEVGTVTVGKYADLLVWDRNPLDDISVLMDRSAIRHIIQSSATVEG